MSNGKWKIASSIPRTSNSPLLLVLGAAALWSTGGLFIKATHLSAFELSFGRSLLAAIIIAIFRHRQTVDLQNINVMKG